MRNSASTATRSRVRQAEFERAELEIEIEFEERRRQAERERERQQQARYADDPVAYSAEKLGIHLWHKQADAAGALLAPPHRVLLKTANGIGKTILAAVIASWFYDNHDPGICVVTAPKFDQIKDITFKEIRRCLRGRSGMMPKNPRIESAPDHYIAGTTANDATAFQGVHDAAILLIFEEGTGIDPEFWEAGRSILISENSYWIVIYNPTSTASQVYAEELSGDWTVVSISAFEHPNILAELGGEPSPIPSAVRLGKLAENMVAEGWGQWVAEGQHAPTDTDTWNPALYGVEWFTEAQAEGIGRHFPHRYWRPGPIGDARILARYPSQAAYSVYSEAAFDLAERSDLEPSGVVRFGCDVARFGDDLTCIVGQRGGVVVHHKAYQGQDTEHTAGRLIELARDWGAVCGCRPDDIDLVIDDTGVGGGVTDKVRAAGLRAIPVNAEQRAVEPDKYPNARSEVHFILAGRMAEGRISLARLPAATRRELRRQALGITYRLDGQGRRVAEPKATTKKRLRRSPDDLDAAGLAFYDPDAGRPAYVPPTLGGVRPHLPGTTSYYRR
jgi:hypothetical protein